MVDAASEAGRHFSRRSFVGGSAAIGGAWLVGAALGSSAMADVPEAKSAPPLEEFGYEQILIQGMPQLAQRANVTAILMGLREDDLLLPFRAMAGMPAPGTSLGGWYAWKPDFDFHHDDVGFAPASTYGQWVSALARLQAGSALAQPRDTTLGERSTRLSAQLAQVISPDYFAKTRFPAYTLDKLVCGLVDTHRLLRDPDAFNTLEKVVDAAKPSLLGHAVPRDTQWKIGADLSWMWDESYTLPENLFLVSALGAGDRYRRMAEAYLEDSDLFEPLSRGVNVLSDRHAYSYVNALCSAMQAWFVGGSAMHLEAARNGFAIVERQSFATGGWGPDELLRKPGYDDIAKSLTGSHNTFEAPCCGYAHMKLARYLLRATRDGRYGDSMERVMINTSVGVLPMMADGRAFYYADYNTVAKRIYSVHRWPCCSGTLPQLVADYGINSYLRDADGVWVNLYQPSELHWNVGKVQLRLVQTGTYPFEDAVHLRLSVSQPIHVAINFRIPAWAEGKATLRIHGRDEPLVTQNGFARVSRRWTSDSEIALTLPMSLRLEQLPSNGGPNHADAVALLCGPTVLFAVREAGDVGPIDAKESALLGAERSAPQEWMVETLKGKRRFVPFTELGDSLYSTYVHLV